MIFRLLATSKGEVCQQYRELYEGFIREIIKCSTPVLKIQTKTGQP